MIQYYTKKHNKLVALKNTYGATWINIAPPFSQEELEFIAKELHIPLDFLTDSLDIDERSRYEKEDDIRLIVINTPIINTFEDNINAAIYITVPIGIITTDTQIITITAFENPVLQRFLDDKIRHFDPTDKNLFILQILEQNVYRYLACLKDLNSKRYQLEKSLYNSVRNKELHQLLGIEKSLVYFVTALSSNELLKMKMQRTDFLRIKDNEFKVDLFADLIIDNSQALEMANTYTNIISGTMDAFASIISNNQNIVIKRLTLVTITLMVPTLITSFFGMNIPNGLEDSSYAIYFVILISVIMTLVLAYISNRKKWF